MACSSRSLNETRIFRASRFLVTRDTCVHLFPCQDVNCNLRGCRYELLFGKRPFRGRTNSALTNSILNEALNWPEDAPGRCSSDGMHAIRGVSIKNVGGHLSLLICEIVFRTRSQ